MHEEGIMKNTETAEKRGGRERKERNRGLI
jgi:hypothetical protein